MDQMWGKFKWKGYSVSLYFLIVKKG